MYQTICYKGASLLGPSQVSPLRISKVSVGLFYVIHGITDQAKLLSMAAFQGCLQGGVLLYSASSKVLDYLANDLLWVWLHIER